MTLPVIADSSIRSGILLDLVECVAALPEVMGVVDDVPFDYKKLPRPRPTHGVSQLPFVFVFEGEEQPTLREFDDLAVVHLPVTLECPYKFSTTDGAQGLKPRGRALLAKLQTAVMEDRNRGSQTLTNGDTVKRAVATTETLNNIEEIDAELGIVILRLDVEYLRDAHDPGQR